MLAQTSARDVCREAAVEGVQEARIHGFWRHVHEGPAALVQQLLALQRHPEVQELHLAGTDLRVLACCFQAFREFW